MEERTLYIDNMVCDRCIMAVRTIFAELNWKLSNVELGRVRGSPPPGFDVSETLIPRLEKIGFRLAEDGSLTGRLKGLIVDFVYHDEKWPNQVLSDVLADSLDRSYGHLSRHFSEEIGRTIEDFYQAHRIERARQLLHKTDLPVSEIALLLRYGTAAHFSNSFRRHTGESPTVFRGKGDYVPRDLTEV